MLDAILAINALLLAMAMLLISTPFTSLIDRRFMQIARRPLLACMVVGALSLLVNLLAGLLVQYPIPAIRDEFSYLLAADTFSQGRLTNATHPMWPHFSGEHIIHEPSYQSKYPPGQALTLALGQVLTGHPIAGVWITLALASAALCWMLQAWVPKGWALLGGLLIVANIGVFTLWGQTYWGGAVAMLGGALLFGALRRIIVHDSPRYAVLFALGLVILANSRPFEGLIASVPACGVLVWHYWSLRPPLGSVARNLVWPSIVVLLPTFMAMGYYNLAVTGHVSKLPYQVWMEQSGTSLSRTITSAVIDHPKGDGPLPTPPNARSQWQKQFLGDYIAARRPAVKFVRQYFFYIGFPLTIPFLFWPMLLTNRWVLFAATSCALVFAGILMNGTAGFAHYTAPIAPLLMFLVLQGMRYIRLWHWHNFRPGQLLVRLVSLHAFVFFAMFVLGDWKYQPVPQHLAWGHDRAQLERKLTQQGGKHLIMVRYGPEHYPQREWVYNRASIDDAPVVWAKELGKEKDKGLRAYFSDRKVWRLAPDEGVSTLASDGK